MRTVRLADGAQASGGFSFCLFVCFGRLGGGAGLQIAG